MNLRIKYSDSCLLQMSPYLAEYLCLKQDCDLWLNVGSYRYKIPLKFHEDHTSIALDKDVARELKISPGIWQVRREKDGIRLGPIIGIVCNRLLDKHPIESPWTSYFKFNEAGFCVLLTPNSFDSERRVVIGRTLSSKGSWIDGEFPWPDTLYIQTYPVAKSFQAFLAKEFPYRFFNKQTHLDKWKVYRVLIQNANIKGYLPKSGLFIDNPQELQTWLEQWGKVYLKPTFGSQGIGIYRVSKDNGNFNVEYRTGKQNQLAIIPNDLPLNSAFSGVFTERQYLIQQAILLTKIEGRTCDLRLLLQKKEDGKWHITAIGGRKGAGGSIVNNLDNGGNRISARELLNSVQVPLPTLVSEIKGLAHKVALTLENEMGVFGEIGLDLGFTEDGRIWIIEVNGRPDKLFFTRDYPLSLVGNIYRAPIQYASYLSGFSEVINPWVR
jgi:glutathione synthase/RimK-type ligase-like ATP-grasp enzyme